MLGSPTPDPSHGPGGLIVIMRPDPVAAARALAHEHGVEVTSGGVATAEAIGRLTAHTDNDASADTDPDPAHDQARPATDADATKTGATDPPDSRLSIEVASTERPTTEPVATAPSIAAPAGPAAAPARRPTDTELDDLAAGMRRADALRDRTRQQVADELCHSLNSSLTIHPDTLRRAAAELIEATQAAALARDGRPPTAKQTRTAQAGTVGAVGALGAAATAVGLVVAWPAGLAVAGVGAASGLARQRTIRRHARLRLPGLEATEALARRRWERVAGSGADPADLEAVIRRYDPNTDMVSDLLAHHPAVRAVQRMADERRQAWVEAWQLAVDDPLSARSSIDRTSDDHPETAEPRADGTTVGGGAGEIEPAVAVTSPPPTTEPAASAGPGAPVANNDGSRPTAPGTVVVVSPYDGLTEVEAHDLHDRLLELRTEVAVIVVLSTDVLGDGDEQPPSAAPDDDIDHRQERLIDLTSRSVLQWPTADPPSSAHTPLSASADTI